ncbi:transcriptional regulator CsgD [Shimwellia pseudoproteus]|uniref:biofilm master transcriptional regulator CsgD n=1 Tax=Shimwellia pseudoproteus TaxID=570012 RepID=UPI0018EAD7F6|nr:biofilm master transcriptional regulator CsgD [Shimwellia pseudoproteus]MBJ3815968.1 transcriptional regulator CsgD [Shimwellia pseudoproteus]
MTIDNNHHDKGVLFLITKPSLQSGLLLTALKKQFYNNSQLIESHIIDTTPFADNDILLFDIAAVDDDAAQHWCRILSRSDKKFRTIIFNTTQTSQYRDISRWPNLSAAFDTAINEQQLIDGIHNVQRGEQCFPKAMSNYIIQQLNLSQPKWNSTVALTYREKEILNKLRQGASNLEIAQLLFISENTVKTHLYNLFKKLAVKNRTQAVFWADKNMR